MAALSVQFGGVLSLFLAHIASQAVPQKADRLGAQHRLRSAFTGGAGLLYMLFWSQNLCAQREQDGFVPRRWGVHLRVADLGIWTAAVRAQGMGHPSVGGWQAYLQCDQGGMAQGRLQYWVGLDDQTRLGSGLAVNSSGIGSLLLSVGVPDWAAHIAIPLRQPSSRPLSSKWQWSVRFPLLDQAQGMADLHWHPGSLPLLSLTATSKGWTGGVGATGAWLSVGCPWGGQNSGAEWRLTLGVLRGDVPWMGLDFGSATAFGSDPTQQWHLQWLWQ